MTTRRDDPHTLILDGEGEEREWRVIHPLTCPWEGFKYSDDLLEPDAEPRWHFHRTCATQWEIDANGIDSLDCYHLLTEDQKALDWLKRYPDWRHIPAGRYVFKTWFSWSGSWYDDADGGMELVT